MRKVLSGDKVFEHTGMKQKHETVWRLNRVRPCCRAQWGQRRGCRAARAPSPSCRGRQRCGWGRLCGKQGSGAGSTPSAVPALHVGRHFRPGQARFRAVLPGVAARPLKSAALEVHARSQKLCIQTSAASRTELGSLPRPLLQQELQEAHASSRNAGRNTVAAQAAAAVLQQMPHLLCDPSAAAPPTGKHGLRCRGSSGYAQPEAGILQNAFPWGSWNLHA